MCSITEQLYEHGNLTQRFPTFCEFTRPNDLNLSFIVIELTSSDELTTKR